MKPKLNNHVPSNKKIFSKPSFSTMPKNANYLSFDENGRYVFYEKKPVSILNNNGLGVWFCFDTLAKMWLTSHFERNAKGWRKSLEYRFEEKSVETKPEPKIEVPEIPVPVADGEEVFQIVADEVKV
jgi:hypothetical protein